MNIVASAVTLYVDDVAASSTFFTTHLGFHESVASGTYACLVRPDATGDIVLQLRGAGERPATGVVVTFTVTDVTGEYDRLVREGVTISVPLRDEPWAERLFEMTDPNGIVIRLVEWTAPAGL
ncbi:Glyoxalase/Bleomycin resistance protein/Dioxygenase superfamily protein [Nonomuraea solani]|uniref:Glyoxalase/Bleomycin resistance protein/Dioxygenase superfamily protein n=1 Tax=Nonomuraea solani TaxID=1144553 RepID=A0A1H6EFK8_9ACTN|nr:VOC family protein [Nonomuraea solani]SEG96562.1 Glyoxalase/Bleomycin resistance protein/Dioxygenase superfamily protein [Nonomuraea solani]